MAGIGEDLEVKRECERGGDIVHKKHGDYLGGGFKYFLCSPVLREMINFDLFEMGGSHHLVVFSNLIEME